MNFLSRLAACLIVAATAVVASCDRFDDYVLAKMASERIPGLQFAVVYKGKTVMLRSYGVADEDKNTVVKDDTDFEIASVSKPIVATAVMMLWEQGKFTLDDPVSKYVKGLPEAWQRVPIRSLLSHTSGITDFRKGRYFAEHRHEETPAADIEKNTPADLDFDPGDHFAYSNTNYLVLGQLIESLTGKPYVDFLQSKIFAPLGMSSTGFMGALDHAQGYFPLVKGYMADRGCSLAWAGPGAGIVSNAGDMAKFEAALQEHKLIKDSTLAKMLQTTHTRLGEIDYGLGWQVGHVGDNLVSLHQGEMNGFSAVYLRLITAQIGIIVLTNTDSIDGNTISRGILGIYFPEMDPKVLTPIVDEDPQATQAHLKILRSILLGNPDMSAFSEDYRAHVSEDKLKAAGKEMRRGGLLKPLQVLRRYEKGGYHVHEYLVTQGETQLILTLLIDQQGKIAGLTIKAP